MIRTLIQILNRLHSKESKDLGYNSVYIYILIIEKSIFLPINILLKLILGIFIFFLLFVTANKELKAEKIVDKFI